MYRILTERPFYGLKVSQLFIQAKFKYKESIDYAIDYYRNNHVFLLSNHLLTRIIHSFNFDPSLSDMEIYKEVEARELRMASAYGLTSSVSPGHFHKKAFYTPNCAIRVMHFENPINIPHWKHIRAVRVLTHPYINTRPILAHQFKTDNEDAYSVIGIDLPLLAIQYKYWFLEQMKKPKEYRGHITDFIVQWVFTGMFPEQIDIAIRNRIEDIGKGVEREEINIKPPFYIQNWDIEFDKALKELIEFYNKGDRTLSEICIGMPMFAEDNLFHSVPKNLEGLNNYYYWTTLLVYTDWYYSLVVTFNIDPQQELLYNKMKKVDRYIKGTRSHNSIPEIIYPKWEEKYNAIMTLWT